MKILYVFVILLSLSCGGSKRSTSTKAESKVDDDLGVEISGEGSNEVDFTEGSTVPDKVTGSYLHDDPDVRSASNAIDIKFNGSKVDLLVKTSAAYCERGFGKRLRAFSYIQVHNDSTGETNTFYRSTPVDCIEYMRVKVSDVSDDGDYQIAILSEEPVTTSQVSCMVVDEPEDNGIHCYP
jgi:hypothetical protein